MSATGSASGITATVHADVWMRPCASVSGTRCTRWPPDSNLSLRIGAAADDPQDHFLVAAELGRRLGHDFDLPALRVRRSGCTSGTGFRRRAPIRRRPCRRGFPGTRCARRWGPAAAASAAGPPASVVHPRRRRRVLLVGVGLHRRIARDLVGRGDVGLGAPVLAVRARPRARCRRAPWSAPDSGPCRAPRPRTTGSRRARPGAGRAIRACCEAKISSDATARARRRRTQSTPWRKWREQNAREPSCAGAPGYRNDGRAAANAVVGKSCRFSRTSPRAPPARRRPPGSAPASARAGTCW